MTIAELFANRDQRAREAAIRSYDEAERTHLDFAEAHRNTGSPLSARIESQRAYLAHRAAVAEHLDPEERVSWTLVCCGWCAVYRTPPEDAKPPHPSEVSA